MSLIELTYVSFATKEMTSEELSNILTVSRQNNEKKDISGMLLYRARYFIQALEGEEAVVENLYKKIATDPRHSNLLLVAKKPIEKRAFSDWSMGFSNLDGMDAAKKEKINQLEGFNDFLDRPVKSDFFSDSPTRAKVLLGSFKNRVWW